MYNSFQTYQDTLNDFEFLQIYSSLEHLQRQINNINYQMYQNRYNNPTFYRNHYYRHPNTNRTRNSQTSSFNLNSTSDPNYFKDIHKILTELQSEDNKYQNQHLVKVI